MDPIEKKLQDEKLSTAITHALDLDNLFKLYSYRCIETEIFLERVTLSVRTAHELLQATEPKHQPFETIE